LLKVIDRYYIGIAGNAAEIHSRRNNQLVSSAESAEELGCRLAAQQYDRR